MVATILVFTGGAPLTPAQRANLPMAELVIGADSGVDRALECGVDVSLAVGDFDSVTEAGLDRVRAGGAEVKAHRPDKDETDLELALLEAVRLEPSRIVVAALDGGRPDHYLANLALLSDVRFRAARVEALLGDGWVSVVHDRIDMTGSVGELVSLLPAGGDAVGVQTSGLHYPLTGETLPAGSPRGMSNTFSSVEASVELAAGSLLCIRPEPESAPGSGSASPGPGSAS